MKKVLIIGENPLLEFWKQQINLKDVAFSIYNGDYGKEKIDDFKPDVVIMDEYFHKTKFKDITRKCISENIKYYIFNEDEKPEIRRYQMCRTVLDRINNNLIMKPELV
jgi:hypothetical protein